MYLAVYRLLTFCLTPIVPFFLYFRSWRGKEDKNRLLERLGYTKTRRPLGKVIWLHGVSVGEIMVLRMVQNTLKDKYPDVFWLITSASITSARLVSDLIKSGQLKRTIHQFCPVDTPFSVDRFLVHWKPDMAIFSESEIWPNLIAKTSSKQIQMALINARLSKRTQKNWLYYRKFAFKILSTFNLILAADDLTQQALQTILQRNIPYTGNIKGAGKLGQPDPDDLKNLVLACHDRLVWLAASTHSREEEYILRTHQNLLRTNPSALLILVPRHLERIMDIKRTLEEMQFQFSIRKRTSDLYPISKNQNSEEMSSDHSKDDIVLPKNQDQIYLVNTMGELDLFYNLSPVSLIGGSLKSEYKGHNPYEPVFHKSVVISGKHVESFSYIYKRLFAQKAAFLIEQERELELFVTEIWSDQNKYQKMTQYALKIVLEDQKALDLTVKALTPLLNKVIYDE